VIINPGLAESSLQTVGMTLAARSAEHVAPKKGGNIAQHMED
jgi:hypothetical protein